ncbi:hypothetical protein G6R40_03255 [Chryseobacterium sp. POL2]|uniref:hypothetical protein n=1 Tax=Chryseobacterium sp. POL2 TaxID=2713414 RepID=UPI0013E179B2|nr:hypothetical protein [Chryseobacterium sp. POL2]QIG88746.1 hypothetical protein G6R40_03255 [Chryseobacterium sp. POL2]
MNTQITLSEVLATPKKDTTGWVRTRAFIDFYSNPIEVMDNGELSGYLIDILVKLDDVSNPEKTLSMKNTGFLIKQYYFPKTHLHSFGRYTGLIILYNEKNLREVIPDPENETWHYEVK